MPSIRVEILGNSASLERSFARAASSAKAFNVAINGSVVNMRRLEPAIKSVGSALTRYVTVPTAALSLVATKMGVDFNRQMLLIQTQAGASAKEVKNLSGEVLNLAKVTPQGPVELAKGLYHLESLGLRGAKAMKTLRISALAAGQGIANLEDVTTALGGVVVTGIKGAQDYQQAMAALVGTVGAGNVRMEDLAQAIGNIAPASSAAGITLKEMGAALATLTDRGFSAEEAATRLRYSLALIQRPTKTSTNALKDMGVDADSLGRILRQPNGLLKVITLLNQGIKRVGAARGNRDLLQAFGGARSGLGIQTLVQSLDQGLSSYQAKLKQVGDNEKQFAKNQKSYLESPAYKLATAWSTIQVSLVKLGTAFAPTAVKIANAAAKIAEGFSALPKVVKGGIGVLVATLAVGGPLLLGISKVIKAIKTMRLAYAAIGTTATLSGTQAEAAMAGAGTSAELAQAKVAGLNTSLAGLPTLVPITIAVAITYESFKHKGQIEGAINKGLGAIGLPGIGGANLKSSSAADKAKSLKMIDAAIASTDPTDLASLAQLYKWRKQLTGLGAPSATKGLGPHHDHAVVGKTTVKKVVAAAIAPLDSLSKIQDRITQAQLGMARGDKGSKAALIAALKDQIDYDAKYAAIQLKLAKKGGKDAKKHAQTYQQLVADETSALDQINSLNEKAKKAEDKAAKKKAALLKKQREAALRAAKEAKDALAQAVQDAKSIVGELGQGPITTGALAQTIQEFGGHLSAQMFTQDITAQNKQGSQFVGNLNRLKKRGAPSGLIQTLLTSGNMEEASALAGASNAQLKTFLSEYKRRQKLLTQVARMEVHSSKVTVNAQTVNVGNTKTDAHDRPGDKFQTKASTGRRR